VGVGSFKNRGVRVGVLNIEEPVSEVLKIEEWESEVLKIEEWESEVLKIEEWESEVLKIEESESEVLCTDSIALLPPHWPLLSFPAYTNLLLGSRSHNTN
jgi:hypothetical protein